MESVAEITRTDVTELNTAPEPEGLTRIMDEMTGYHSEFAKTYANHAPMVLVALSRIGGSTERLYDFFEHYRDDKHLLTAQTAARPIDADNWQAALGQREREADYRVFFDGEVARLGIDGALRRYLTPLARGIGASALHALMRTAYAILRGSETDTAIALAYWCATYLELPAPTGSPPVTADPAEVLARTSAIEALHGRPVREMLWHNMRQSAQTPEFAPVVDWLAVGPDTLARMASASIALFAATQEFCALHAVTGTHWVRLVLPHTDRPDLLQRHFWQALAALMPQMGFPVLPDAATLDAWRALPAPEWDAIEKAAAGSYDEHDISLVFSAREEMKVYGDPLYRLAAARRMGLVPAYAEGV